MKKLKLKAEVEIVLFIINFIIFMILCVCLDFNDPAIRYFTVALGVMLFNSMIIRLYDDRDFKGSKMEKIVNEVTISRAELLEIFSERTAHVLHDLNDYNKLDNDLFDLLASYGSAIETEIIDALFEKN